jgi:secreted PhoX family phosphatase
MTEGVQLRTFGAHIDGMHLFPFPAVGSAGLANTRGLLVTNHEYVDPALVNNITPASAYATASLTLDMVRAQQAAPGISVVVRFRSAARDLVADDVTFTSPVPEPEVYATLLSGLGLMGWMARRRHRKTAYLRVAPDA